jgi:putative ABC transport system permease protein
VKITQVLIESFRSMGANRLRTVLTMLGIVIGITSVTLLLALGDSMQRFIGKELEALGTNMVYVFPGGTRTDERRMRANATPALTFADAQALNSIKSLSGAAPALQGGFKLAAGSETASQLVFGVTPEMFTVRNWTLDRGSVFSDAEVRASARVVVIGKKIVDQFFYKVDPLGKSIRIENVAFEVVGVLHGEGKQIDGANLADMVIVPITAARAHLVHSPTPENVHYIAAQGKSGQSLLECIEDIKEMLRDRHRIKLNDPDDFRVENVASFAAIASKVSAGVAMLLSMIGAISLVVGGIGIMNIMLVSVTERTREIGIRMAIGAKPRDVLMQFLSEAVVICLAGGAVGILIAVGCAAAITSTGRFDVVVTSSAIAVACCFSGVVGIFFGFYPARRASRLMPVDCLRYE